MTTRRSRGDGGLSWCEKRQRWIAAITVGYTPAGKRIYRRASGKTKTEAKKKLDRLRRDYEDGLVISTQSCTVTQIVRDWLAYGLNDRDRKTVEKYTYLANGHLIPDLGARKIQELSPDDVDHWLARKSQLLSTQTLRELRSVLKRSIDRAQARGKVKRNVVLLCECPKGTIGRPSKALNFQQAEAILLTAEADNSTTGAYVVVSLLTGTRTEEARPLTWAHVYLHHNLETPPYIAVWRSVRAGGETKTKKSRRTLALPNRVVTELLAQRQRQQTQRQLAGKRWKDHDLVFASEVGTPLDAANVRRGFRRIVKKAGLNPHDWTPRELRHSFVSLLSDAGIPIKQISRLVGHSGTSVTETVYRHQSDQSWSKEQQQWTKSSQTKLRYSVRYSP